MLLSIMKVRNRRELSKNLIFNKFFKTLRKDNWKAKLDSIYEIINVLTSSQAKSNQNPSPTVRLFLSAFQKGLLYISFTKELFVVMNSLGFVYSETSSLSHLFSTLIKNELIKNQQTCLEHWMTYLISYFNNKESNLICTA